MARTAPAPNVPPIPGMCPGVAVAGGGGGGGGGGGSGSKSGKGKKGAGKQKGKKNPKGGKKSAKDKKNKCGKGGKGGPQKCTGCSKKPGAGEPIDVASGEVFIPTIVDMFLDAPMPFSWERSYESGSAHVDLGLGWGWTHSLAFRLEPVGPRRIVAIDGDGLEKEFPQLAIGTDVEVEGWRLLREHGGYWLDPGTGQRHFFAEVKDGYQLQRIVSRTRNRIELERDRHGAVVRLIDSADREVLFARDRAGRITSVTVPDPTTRISITFARYEYDSAGHLIAVIDADGHTTRYEYDDNHRLLRLCYPDGPTFHYRYDGEGRCVESWGELRSGDPCLDPSTPAVLFDGSTPAKGIHHVVVEYLPGGSREVTSATEIQRFDVDDDGNVIAAVGNGGVTTREVDDRGNVVSETDRNGHTTKYEWDAQRRLVSETDPLGRVVRYLYDANGHVVEMIDPAGGTIRSWRNADGVIETIQDQAGGVTTYRWDERGLMSEKIEPNGVRTVYTVDAHGNLVAAQLANGAVWQWRYDWWGRVVERVDPKGNSTRYWWTDGGHLRRVRERDGTEYVFGHDALGNLVETILPDGTVFRKQWGGMNWLVAESAPNGDTVRATYDRDGQMVAVINENGEVTRYTHGVEGILQDRGFGGETQDYRLDAMGRLIGTNRGFGWLQFQRDAVGDVVAITHPDGEEESFEYDVRGELIVARNSAVEVRLERDRTGRVVRETVTAFGRSTEVRSFLGADGACRRKETSFGRSVDFTYDAMGESAAQSLNQSRMLRFQRNAFGMVERTILPEEGVIENQYDAMLRLTQRSVQPRGAVSVRSDEPVWVGKRLPTHGFQKTFEWSPRGLLIAQISDRGNRAFEYDARDRLLRRVSEDGSEERFSYDPGSSLFEIGRRRSYAPGGRLEAREGVLYHYDDAGYLREREDSTGSTTYEWSARGALKAVTRPDGVRVEFAYDSFNRRISKRVFSADEIVLSDTRYLWDDLRLLHAERTDGTGHKRHTNYVYRDADAVIAIGEHQYDEGEEGDWIFYSADVVGTPEELLRADGTTAAEVVRTAWGAMTFRGSASTDVRLPGQFFDEETGLSYNMCRYYDPSVGRFISPDPTGIEGGTAPYAYTSNPITSYDPFGLDEHALSFEVYDPKGKSVWSGDLKSGGYETDGKKKYGSNGKMNWKWDEANAKHDYPSKGPGNLMNQSGAHTEGKFLHQLDNNDKAKKAVQKGGVAKLKGGYPPCKRCHRRMEDWAKKNAGEGSLEYHYPVKQVMKYSAKGSEAMTTGPALKGKVGDKGQAAGGAAGLKKAYDSGDSAQADKIYDAQKKHASQPGNAGSYGDSANSNKPL